MLTPRPNSPIHVDREEPALSLVRKIPWVIVAIMLLLGAVGVLLLYSAAEGSWSPWALQHALRLALGFALMAMVAALPIEIYRRLSAPGWLVAVGLLVLVEFVGTGTGVQRWINLGYFNLQPSEPAKLAVILMLAAGFRDTNLDKMRNILTYIPALAIVLVPFGLVLAQPDMGTAVMLLGGAVAVVFVAGVPAWMIGAAAALAFAALPLAWSQLYPYQKERILVFFNPGTDNLGAGYQIIQSKIALGSGGLNGKGYLQGSQARLNYLPEKQTDFIFTIVGEEFGFLGCCFVIGLYILLIFQMAKIGLRLTDVFSRLVVVGVSSMLFLYVFVNIGMVSGLLPVVGAPLPLISYGGTAVMTVFIAVGLIISAVIYEDRESFQ